MFFLFLFLSHFSYSQNVDFQKFRLADSLFSQGKFQAARIEYERIIFYSQKIEEQNFAHLRKAKCFKQEHLFSQAVDELSQIRFSNISDSLNYQARYEIALCSFLAGDFSQAKSQILQMKYFVKDSTKVKQSLFLEVLIFNELREYQMAHQKAKEWVYFTFPDSLQEKIVQKIDSFYNERNIPVLKKRNILRWVSFLPGAGHCYAGYWAEGFWNFFLNAACLSFGVFQVYFGYYFTGYFIGAGLLEKFYFGGMRRSHFLLEKRNYLETQNFNDKIKNFILTGK